MDKEEGQERPSTGFSSGANKPTTLPHIQAIITCHIDYHKRHEVWRACQPMAGEPFTHRCGPVNELDKH